MENTATFFYMKSWASSCHSIVMIIIGVDFDKKVGVRTSDSIYVDKAE